MLKGIFDAVRGGRVTALVGYPHSLDTIYASWVDETNALNEADSLEELRDAYEAYETGIVLFGVRLADGTLGQFTYRPGESPPSAVVSVRGRPDKVDAMIEPVRAAFPLERKIEKELKGYLDTCLVSGLAERDLRPAELMALRELLRARKAGRIELATSKITLEELNKMSGEKRDRHADLYALLEDVQAIGEMFQQTTIHGGSAATSRYVGFFDDPLFAGLKVILPDVDDARHLFQAIKNGVDYFVTVDERTIVSRVSEIEALHPIKVRLPSQVVTELALGPGE